MNDNCPIRTLQISFIHFIVATRKMADSAEVREKVLERIFSTSDIILTYILPFQQLCYLYLTV